MSVVLADRGPRSVASEGSLAARTIGNAFVVHPKSGVDGQVHDLAMAVTPDPRYDLVLLDLPEESPASVWEEAAALFPRGRRGARVVVHGRSRESTALAGHWLAGRLGRPVVVPDGDVVLGLGGTLFVDPLQGTGWVRLQRRHPAVHEARRYPRPEWETAVLAETIETSGAVVAEPIPGGAWLHSTAGGPHVAAHRDRLRHAVPTQAGLITIVLGCPGDEPLSLDDVARFWEATPDALRAGLRPVQYGPLQVSDGIDWARALADLLGTSITVYNGVPAGAGAAPETYTVLEDGVFGWRTRARELRYFPSEAEAEAEAEARPPQVVSLHTPLAAAHEVAPGAFWYAPDAVVEVVAAGLWIRPAAEPAHARRLRALPTEAGRHVLLFEDSTPEEAGRMRGLASDVLAQLDPATTRLSRLQPVSEVVGGRAAKRQHVSGAPLLAVARTVETDAAPLPPTPGGDAQLSPLGGEEPAQSLAVSTYDYDVPEVPAPGQIEVVSTSTPRASLRPGGSVLEPAPPEQHPHVDPLPAADRMAAVRSGSASSASVPDPSAAPRMSGSAVLRWQSRPAAMASAVPMPGTGLDRERAWLRQALRDRFAAASTSVARVLSENPAFSGALARSAEDVLTDSVAVRLHLSTEEDELSGPLRHGASGPHVPLARCTVSGLSRLPSHRGVTAVSVQRAGMPWRILAARTHLTEWGFLEATAGGGFDDRSDFDLAVWSLTARRTRLLEPRASAGPERVVFLPGTSFGVLEVVEPVGSARGRVLLRELAAAELTAEGGFAGPGKGIDEIALAALRSALDDPGRRGASTGVRSAPWLPGLVETEGTAPR